MDRQDPKSIGAIQRLEYPIVRGELTGRYAKALAIGRGDLVSSISFATGQGPRWKPVVDALKAAANPMTTVNGNDLVVADNIAADFIELLRPLAILPRLTAARRVPFNIKALSVASGVNAAWIGEQRPIRVQALDFDTDTVLPWLKVAAITLVSEELLRDANPSVDISVARDLSGAAAYAMDAAFISVDNTGAAGVKPSSVTKDAAKIISTGAAVANIDADLRSALRVLGDANIDLTSAVWITAPRTAVYLATLRGTGGAPAFPGMTARGGVLLGLPVLTSTACIDASSPSESTITLLAQDQVDVADDGESLIDLGWDVSLQMTDTPVEGAQQLVSAWQAGLAALRAIRYANWRLRNSSAVAVIEQVQY